MWAQRMQCFACGSPKLCAYKLVAMFSLVACILEQIQLSQPAMQPGWAASSFQYTVLATSPHATLKQEHAA